MLSDKLNSSLYTIFQSRNHQRQHPLRDLLNSDRKGEIGFISLMGCTDLSTDLCLSTTLYATHTSMILYLPIWWCSRMKWAGNAPTTVCILLFGSLSEVISANTNWFFYTHHGLALYCGCKTLLLLWFASGSVLIKLGLEIFRILIRAIVITDPDNPNTTRLLQIQPSLLLVRILNTKFLISLLVTESKLVCQNYSYTSYTIPFKRYLRQHVILSPTLNTTCIWTIQN